MLAHVRSSRSRHVDRFRRGFYRLYFQTSRKPRRSLISEGRRTEPEDTPLPEAPSRSPFYFETGYAIFAKRASRPFPPPFVSYPSGSFSDPLTTHDRVRYRLPKVEGELLRGITNGDDAIIIDGQHFLAVNDGVGAWAQKARGHAALWSRLIAHYWAAEVEKALSRNSRGKDLREEGVDAAKDRIPASEQYLNLHDLDLTAYLTTAYEKTKRATASSSMPSPDGKEKEGNASGILGTTTASGVLLHHRTSSSSPSGNADDAQEFAPIILATTLGDSAIFVIRPGLSPPSDSEADSKSPVQEHDPRLIYKSKEQWHWFDCPRQLGTNSPDTPAENAVTDIVEIEEGDAVLCVSDGVTDNLWEHEITETVSTAIGKWNGGHPEAQAEGDRDGGIVYVARELMNAARVIAQDPSSESPYMERALDEGIAAEGGKLDDISVVIGVCRRRKT